MQGLKVILAAELLISESSIEYINTDKIIRSYLLTINVLTFVIYDIDQYKAKHSSKWRISEADGAA